MQTKTIPLRFLNFSRFYGKVPYFVFLFTVFCYFNTYAVSSQFLKDCRFLTQTPHRLTGTKECFRASSYIEKRLREIGVDSVITQEFEVAQTRAKRCEMIVSASEDKPARKITLYPVRPDGIIPPVTPPEGISGRIVYAGKGELEEFYRNGSPKGKIVVLDYNTGRNWLTAFRLGAKAVIFVSNEPARAENAHYIEANANLPRYYYPGPKKDLLEEDSVRIQSEIVWETVKGRNVFAFIRGTNALFSLGKEEMVVLAANIDSYGEIPRLSPGARGAANCAGLLKLAKHFKDNRPQRHILLAFFDGQARGYAGTCAFYRALEEDYKKVSVEKREKYLRSETAFLDKLLWAFGQDNPINQKTTVQREFFDMLKKKADKHAFTITDTLLGMRRKESMLEGGREKRVLGISIKEHEKEKTKWNDLRRCLSRRDFTAGLDKQTSIALNEVEHDVKLRKEELKQQERFLEDDRLLKKLIGKYWISLHVSLLLGDNTQRWGIIVEGDSKLNSVEDKHGLYGKIQGCFLSAYKSLQPDTRPENFATASVDASIKQSRLLWSVPFLSHSGEVAGHMGIYNVAIGTCQEKLEREGTPEDILSSLNMEKIESQVDEAGMLVGAAADREGLSLLRSIVPKKGYYIPSFESNKAKGPVVMGETVGSNIPDKRMPDATLQITFSPESKMFPYTYQPVKPYGFDNFQVVRTNCNGNYSLGPIVYRNAGIFAIKCDSRGEVKYASSMESSTTPILRFTRQNIYRCHSGFAVDLPSVFPRGVKVMNAVNNTMLNKEKSYYDTRDGVTFWFAEKKNDRIKLFGGGTDPSVVCLFNGNRIIEESGVEQKDASGMGMPVEWYGLSPPNYIKRSAVDLWRLTESRLKLLRSKGAMNSSLEEIHEETNGLLIESKACDSLAKSEALSASAFMNEKSAYIRTNAIISDLVHAVLVLLALAIPFAFAMERVVIGAATVYKQITWFVIFFAITLSFLYMTHPAFDVSATPMIVFLGFALVVLSSIVIIILMRKFENELKQLQGMSLGVHTADVSRFGTIMAAMSMGVSTMRRRPMRTTLTAVTIVLLTFTILSFASFGTSTGIVKLFIGPPQKYSGVQVHKSNWQELDPGLLNIIRLKWNNAAVCPRYWVAPKNKEREGFAVSRDDGSNTVIVKGALGITENELSVRTDIAGLLNYSKAELSGRRSASTKLIPLWYKEKFAESVWMTSAVAGRLHVQIGDQVLVCGERLRVAGLLVPDRIIQIKDMDESGILPVDFVEMAATGLLDTLVVKSGITKNLQTFQESSGWSNLSVDECVVVPAGKAIKMGATLHAINIYTESTQKAEKIAENLAGMMPLPVNATRSNGVYINVLGPVLKASGLKDLLFPILLGGLVIFGTMLGSVTDREKEIYSFSALGLAPPHIGGLFFAEAMVYSVIGGMGGYLVANGLFKILEFIAGYGLVEIPEVNYSSSNAIVTILIVMATVLISTIYPAIKASRSANPGVLRSWHLPMSHGNTFNIAFPFTVSAYDMTGIVSFLKEHFDNYSDSGLGSFIARNPVIIKEGESSLGLNAHLALAPFDLGVTQSFELRSSPSEIPGIDEVKIRLTRISGQQKDWQRLNKVLLNNLRRQFLIWRSLKSETMEMYRQRTLAEIGE